jgi:hypothetical protein
MKYFPIWALLVWITIWLTMDLFWYKHQYIYWDNYCKSQGMAHVVIRLHNYIYPLNTCIIKGKHA